MVGLVMERISLPLTLRLSLLLLLLGQGSAVQAVNVYKYVDEDGVVSFSSERPHGRSYQDLGPSCAMAYMGCERAGWDWSKAPLNMDDYREPIQRAAERHGVDPALVRAVVHAESSFNRLAVSRAGAQGLMQLMPQTQRSYNVADPFDVEANLNGGTQLLSELLKRYNNDISLAAAAYNAGPTAVARYNGIPPFKETRNYVERVNLLYTRYRASLSASR